MKKRHQQKLVILSIVLLFLLNIPLIMIFDWQTELFGIPVLYAYIFGVWLVSIGLSYWILNRYFE